MDIGIDETVKDVLDEVINAASNLQSQRTQQNEDTDNNFLTKNSHIRLRLVDAKGSQILYKVKRNTAFRKLRCSYANRNRLPCGQLKMLFDGERIKDDDTPENLQMEQNDIIEVVLEQAGGT